MLPDHQLKCDKSTSIKIHRYRLSQNSSSPITISDWSSQGLMSLRHEIAIWQRYKTRQTVKVIMTTSSERTFVIVSPIASSRTMNESSVGDAAENVAPRRKYGFTTTCEHTALPSYLKAYKINTISVDNYYIVQSPTQNEGWMSEWMPSPLHALTYGEGVMMMYTVWKVWVVGFPVSHDGNRTFGEGDEDVSEDDVSWWSYNGRQNGEWSRTCAAVKLIREEKFCL